MRRLTLFIVVLILIPSQLFSKTLNVPAEYVKIQDAIDIATDGDTILVQPGRYSGRINFKSKGIVVGSLTLIDQDTSWIARTILDGNRDGAVVTITNALNEKTELNGFTITNGWARSSDAGNIGAGIRCTNSKPLLKNLNVANNTASNGGGIALINSSARLINSRIVNNEGRDGGGFLISGQMDGQPSILQDLVVQGNVATDGGGGMRIYSADLELSNVLIHDNSLNYGSFSYPRYGGGVNAVNSDMFLSNVTISWNVALFGAGCYFENSNIEFDSSKRSNIFFNYGRSGRDLYSNSSTVTNVVLDTFTVSSPDDYFAEPAGDFTFDILNTKVQQTGSGDVYVSRDGDNSYSGLSASEPVRNIVVALCIIKPDSSNPQTIHLANGIYSPTQTGELFPLRPRNHMRFAGESKEQTILSGDSQSALVVLSSVEDIAINNLTMTDGASGNGGAVYMGESDDIVLEHLIITGNTASRKGGGIRINNASARLSDLLITGNAASDEGGGLALLSASDVTIANVMITNNSAGVEGGGLSAWGSNFSAMNSIISANSGRWAAGLFLISSDPEFLDVHIVRNTASEIGGGIYMADCNPYFAGVTVAYNSANQGGGIYFERSDSRFDETNLSSIYLNEAAIASDMFAHTTSDSIAAVLDTFTVRVPAERFVSPLAQFDLTIGNAKVQPVAGDVFVSPEGDDNNSGLTSGEALKTISFALKMILADSLNPGIVHLADGHYSTSSTGEIYPLNIPPDVVISGNNKNEVILDGENKKQLVKFTNSHRSGLRNVTIQNGTALEGGGIYSINSDITLSDLTVRNSIAQSRGGGIFISNSDAAIQHSDVYGNYSRGNGGGVLVLQSRVDLLNTQLTRNIASRGGGLSCRGSSTSLASVDVSWNTAGSGGGIWLDSAMEFDAQNLCNVYLNQAPGSKDIYAERIQNLTVNLDTFTVKEPDALYITAPQPFVLNIKNSRVTQVTTDLYVSPGGSDYNNGTTSDSPFRTITMALASVKPDSTTPVTIHLENALYSPSTNGEVYPLYPPGNVKVKGSDRFSTILDAEGLDRVLHLQGVDNVGVSDLTITGGRVYEHWEFFTNDRGEAIYCYQSELDLSNIRITGVEGTGYTVYAKESDLNFYKSELTHNTLPILAGNVCDFVFTNTTIADNLLVDENYTSALNLATNDVVFINSIVRNPSLYQFRTWDRDNLVVQNSNVRGGWQGTGNVDVDPQFNDAEHGDYTLNQNSPCIDQGIGFFVWRGDTILDLSPDSFDGQAPDMGAYEYGIDIPVAGPGSSVPETYKLYHNYPNPFNPTTNFRLDLPVDANVKLVVYNILGQKVGEVYDGFLFAGTRTLIWESGGLPSGVYLFRLEIRDVESHKLIHQITSKGTLLK